MSQEKKQRWLISYHYSYTHQSQGVAGKRTIEIDKHPVAWLNGRTIDTVLLFALRLHPEDPVLGEES